MSVTIGVDIGQKREPTAIAVAEREHRARNGRREAHFLIRCLERLPTGTRYPEVATRVGEIAAAVIGRSSDPPTIYADVTGLGEPIVNLLKARTWTLTIKPVYFTHGDRRSEDMGEVKLGKAWLVTRLQALLQTGCLHLPRTPEAEVLARELRDYEIRVDADANEKYGAFRVGTHDDLVTALGLAVQKDFEYASFVMDGAGNVLHSTGL